MSQHLISYYRIEDVTNGRLRSPSSLPELASLDISPEYLDKTHFRNPPKVEVGVDGLPRYRGEADDIDTSPTLLSAPLSTGLPLLTDGRVADASGANRRGKRFDPYGSPSVAKRPRRHTKTTPEVQAPPEQPLEPQPVSPAPVYPDANTVMPPPAQYSPYGLPNYYQMPGYPMPPPPPMFYPPGNAPPQQQPQPPPPPQYHYGYTAPTGADAQQPPQDVQRPYYTYPAPQSVTYPPGYSSAWPPYSGYPHVQTQHPQSSVAIEGEKKSPGTHPAGDGQDTTT